MAFKGIDFITASNVFDRRFKVYDPAPMFRRSFELEKIDCAELCVCGLGYAYYYINGQPVSKDLFTAPISDYNKILWYNRYDVTKLLKPGKNTVAVILGNGFFNESFASHWKNSDAPWRDNPKFILSLSVGGRRCVVSDADFKCSFNSPVLFNHLRSGEVFDARLYNPKWADIDFDDTDWENAVIDSNPPQGELRECLCEPIREIKEYRPIEIKENPNGYIVDFGQNIAGYVRIKLNQREGDIVTVSHAEEIFDDGRLKLNNLNVLYPHVPFQTDVVVCLGKEVVWSPKFTYHGFRYVEIQGLSSKPDFDSIRAILVCQDIKRTSDFSCGDELLNKIYNAGIMSVYSNLHYTLTDCPTREKFGWMNDAQASAEQIVINFAIKKFFEKWIEDIKASMNCEGDLPAIVPSHGYGFKHGPVADGALFEIPYRIYEYTGDGSMLISCVPHFKKYVEYLKRRMLENHTRLLGDWDGVKNFDTPIEYLEQLYYIRFLKILRLAMRLADEKSDERYKEAESVAVREFLDRYIDKDGKCTVNEQTAVAMLIMADIAEDESPLGKQLLQLVDDAGGHHACGMVGIQYIFDALTKVGRSDYAYKIITADGIPGFKEWFKQGATTLWETWKDEYTDSRNHHMLSNVLAWFIRSVLGLAPNIDNPGFGELILAPNFIREIGHCSGYIDTVKGRISASWKIDGKQVEYIVEIPLGVNAAYNGKVLTQGKNVFLSDV